jgi:hypothetical protein
MAEATDASPAAIDVVVGMTKIVTTVMTIAPTGRWRRSCGCRLHRSGRERVRQVPTTRTAARPEERPEAASDAALRAGAGSGVRGRS